MEILKIRLNPTLTKVALGAEYNEDKRSVQGTVELDIENQGHFVEIINDIFNTPHMLVVVDLELVTYIDSSGLWALFEGHKKASQRAGRLALLKPSKDVKRVLDITKMSSKMLIYDNEASAVEALMAMPQLDPPQERRGER
ncbi:MAG: STAS domain-containing protein [Candidatus Margulisiibacteriota bacterium]